jgi:uncharacterized membrane protein (DUF485 family)
MPGEEAKHEGDRAPTVGAATDIASLGRSGAKPAHELTADEEPDIVHWGRVAATPEFQQLLRAKRRFVIPAMLVFVSYYFALPILVGYARPLMERRVMGAVNIAYLFALSQFFMAWMIAALYVRAAARFDRMAREVVERDRE